ncbi:hypothetical protein D3C71_2038020 [compost metagenome]
MLCAMLGCRPPVLASARKSLAEACAQASKPYWPMSASMSLRTGIEPLLLLNRFWKSLPSTVRAMSCWPAAVPASFCRNTTSESML